MDMKKILQAIDGASTKPVEGTFSVKKFLQIVKEGAVPNTTELPVIKASDLVKNISAEDPNAAKEAAKLVVATPDGNVDIKQTLRKMSGMFIQTFPDIIEVFEEIMNTAIQYTKDPAFKTLPPNDQQTIVSLTQMGPQIQQMKQQTLNLAKQHDTHWNQDAQQSGQYPLPERVTIGPDGQVTGGLKPTPADPNTPSPSSISQNPGPLTIPGADLPKAEKADRNSNTVTVGGRDYTIVMLEPGGLRPRGGQRFALPRAMMGIRGLGNYIGILAGDKAYILPQGEQESIQQESLFSKYYKKVEQELLESKNQKDKKAKKLADKVIKEYGGNYGHPSRIKNHISKTMMPPENIRNMAKQSAKNAMRNEETEGVDSVTMDVPLLIRLMEFAREDAQDDMVLHQIAERLVGMAEEGQSLSMSDYEDIVGQMNEAHGNSKIYDKCWTGYKKVPGKKRGEDGSCKKK